MFIIFWFFDYSKIFDYDELEMLDDYKKKRNFMVYPEPNGSNDVNKENFAARGDASISTDDHNQSKTRPRFVIQKHEATRLHYNF